MTHADVPPACHDRRFKTCQVTRWNPEHNVILLKPRHMVGVLVGSFYLLRGDTSGVAAARGTLDSKFSATTSTAFYIGSKNEQINPSSRFEIALTNAAPTNPIVVWGSAQLFPVSVQCFWFIYWRPRNRRCTENRSDKDQSDKSETETEGSFQDRSWSRSSCDVPPRAPSRFGRPALCLKEHHYYLHEWAWSQEMSAAVRHAAECRRDEPRTHSCGPSVGDQLEPDRLHPEDTVGTSRWAAAVASPHSEGFLWRKWKRTRGGMLASDKSATKWSTTGIPGIFFPFLWQQAKPKWVSFKLLPLFPTKAHTDKKHH